MSPLASVAATVGSFPLRFQTLFQTASRTQIAVGVVAIAAGLPLVAYIQSDYRSWLGLGKGGPPYNLFGYAVVKFLGVFGSTDIYSTECYDDIALQNSNEATSYFNAPLPDRQGTRPAISRFAAPVRQLTDAAPEDLKLKLASAIKVVADTNALLIEARPSSIEGGHHPQNAVHTLEGKEEPERIFSPRGPHETYHFHPSDGSAHAILSATDVKKLLNARWGERHPISGARFGGIPINYVMIYAPRNDNEVAIHEMIARAATRYALRNGHDLATVKAENVEKVPTTTLFS